MYLFKSIFYYTRCCKYNFLFSHLFLAFKQTHSNKADCVNYAL